MELSRKDYPALLESLQPGQAVAVLNERLKHVSRVNNDIADFLQERRRLEDAYVQGLRKLARRQLPDDGADLGVFAMPWAKIVSATEALAESHHQLAQKLESDVERPLRDFEKTNREMQAMSTISGNMNAMAKEIENAQKKADKLQGKGAKASAGKVASASTEVENATQQWNSQAPFIMEQLQSVDESRVNHLRDALTQFQTLELDQSDRQRGPAEQALGLLLEVQTADEIKTFALKTSNGKPKIERQRSRGQTPAAATSSLSPIPPPTPDDGSSQRSGSGRPLSSADPNSGSRIAVHEQKHGGLHGLKRLGTVLGRRRQSTAPYGRASSPERKSTANIGSAFGSFGSRGTKSRDVNEHRPSSPSRLAESQIPSSPEPSESLASPGFSRHSADRPNGVSTIAEDEGPGEGDLINGGQGSGIPQLQEPLKPTSPSSPTPEPQKDAEGFSVPASSATADLFAQAEQDAASESIPPQFKVDIRNAPIQEEDSNDAETAIANVTNTLRMQAAPVRKSGTTRGRRDVRNTIFIPNPSEAPELPPFGLQPGASPIPSASPSIPSPSPSPLAAPAPIPVPASPPAMRPQSPLRPASHRLNLGLGEDHPASDTQSIRSGRSLSSSTSHTIRHPDLHEPGLNSSIVETVSTWFEHGNVMRAVVIGELALAYNPVDLSVPFGHENIRLENFPVLEKVAPNPTFIEQIPDKAGEYTIDLAKITRTQVGFKYQVHLDETNVAAYAPITLTPAWKIEPTQTSVILNYSLNPAFRLGSGRTSVTLSNVILLIHLDPTGPRASHCQSKPVGTFSKDKSLIYWRIGELTLSADQPAQQLRARFYTETEAKAGPTEARWEIAGEHAALQGSGLHVSQLVQEAAEEVDPFADTDETTAPSEPTVTAKEIATVKRISSGTYNAV